MAPTKTNKETIEPLMNASVLRGLRLPITEQHVDYEKLLHQCGLDPREIAKENAEIPFKRYLDFMEAAAEEAGEPLLGIRLSRSAGPETLGAIGFLFLSSPSLLKALSDFCLFLNILQGTTHVELRHEGNEVVFKYDLFSVPDGSCRQDVEFSLALTSRMIQMLAGPDAKISRIHFRHSPGAPISDYARLLRMETRFNQEDNGIYLPASSMQTKGRLFDPSLSQILRNYLEEELRQRDQIRSFADQVRHTILNSGVAPPVTAPKAARHLGLSKATLYRRLREEGTTYGDIQEEVNFGIAKSYLEESALTITQIGQILGFAECASFSRAFARWAQGMTPSQYRQQQKVGFKTDVP
ncbi:MAG: AraC family transcriptional regulator [Pseudomonadota bacterium]